MKDVASFSGVWRRTKLFEPIGSLGPEEEQLKDVLWIQSRKGYFIDIRYQTGATSHLKMKSFAGVGSFDVSNSHFTWDRKFDFRAPGAADVGLMRLLEGNLTDPLQLEEDGVLPGDDYREIWDRLSPSDKSTDMTVRIAQKDAIGNVTREGLFLIVGKWFAITISRPLDDQNDVRNLDLKRIFDESVEVPSTSTGTYLWDYISVVGSTSTWQIDFALHPELRGTTILPGKCAHPLLSSLLHSFSSEAGGLWEWDVVDGALPAALSITQI